MSRQFAILSALVVVVAVALGGLILTRPTGMQESDVRAMVAEMLDDKTLPAQMNTATIDPATIHPMIESYLMANPRILERMSTALRTEVETEDREKSRVALASMQSEIYQDPDHVVIGNPDGKVTLVEMFDYNCGYCRSSLPDMAALIEANPDLKVILKEFPILSEESVDAARIAVVVARSDVDYWAFHTDLFTSRGKVTKQTALDAAAKLGLNPVTIELDAQSDDVGHVIQRSYDIAQAVGTSGTPTYIIGDDVIPGAVGREELQKRIDNMRDCGKTVCPS